MVEPEDEDVFPNDYDGLDFDSIPGLQAPTISTPDSLTTALRNIVPPATGSPIPSTGSNSVEDMDSTFLAAVDALEARALREGTQDSEALLCTEFGGHPTDGKILDCSQGELSSINRKGKRKAEPQEEIGVRAILAGYETELTCPICCDMLVGAQVSNPCGHTCCGECSYGWLARNKYEPTCAVCRSKLSIRKPLLPNFSVDNFVRQHLWALAKSGRPEWQEKGYRTIEWNKRLDTWKNQVAVRAAKEKSPRARRRQSRYYQVEEYSYAPWLIDESTDDDENAVVARVPRRGTRPRR